jgi:hypothetical protein
VAGCHEYGDEPLGSSAMELVSHMGLGDLNACTVALLARF